MRRIDADALIEELRDWADPSVITFINDAPTVEPEKIAVANVTFDKEQLEEIVEKAKADILTSVQRTTSKWKKDDMTGILDCTACGMQAPIDITSGEYCESPYCPWCGKQMLGGDSDD